VNFLRLLFFNVWVDTLFNCFHSSACGWTDFSIASIPQHLDEQTFSAVLTSQKFGWTKKHSAVFIPQHLDEHTFQSVSFLNIWTNTLFVFILQHWMNTLFQVFSFLNIWINTLFQLFSFLNILIKTCFELSSFFSICMNTLLNCLHSSTFEWTHELSSFPSIWMDTLLNSFHSSTNLDSSSFRFSNVMCWRKTLRYQATWKSHGNIARCRNLALELACSCPSIIEPVWTTE